MNSNCSLPGHLLSPTIRWQWPNGQYLMTLTMPRAQNDRSPSHEIMKALVCARLLAQRDPLMVAPSIDGCANNRSLDGAARSIDSADRSIACNIDTAVCTVQANIYSAIQLCSIWHNQLISFDSMSVLIYLSWIKAKQTIRWFNELSNNLRYI